MISIDAARKYLASLGFKLAKYPPSALNGYIRFHLDRFIHIADYVPALTAKFGKPRIEGGTANGKHWTWDLGNRRWLVLEWDRDDQKTPYTVTLRDGAQKNYYGKDGVTSNHVIQATAARLELSAPAKPKVNPLDKVPEALKEAIRSAKRNLDMTRQEKWGARAVKVAKEYLDELLKEQEAYKRG